MVDGKVLQEFVEVIRRPEDAKPEEAKRAGMAHVYDCRRPSRHGKNFKLLAQLSRAS